LLRTGCSQALHGCRQFVSRDVALSCPTNATHEAYPRDAPAVISRELSVGVAHIDYAASLLGPLAYRPCGRSQVNMAYIGWATHVPQGQRQRAATAKAGATPQNLPQFGLRAATRAHEAETVSNRASTCHGEAKPSSAHTAHHARKVCLAGGAGAAQPGC